MIKNFTLSRSMREFLKKRTSQKGALTLLLLGFGFIGQAQIGVTVDNPTTTTPPLNPTYNTLGEALSALNGLTGMNGAIKLTLGTGTEILTDPKGLTLGSTSLNPLLSAANNITIVAAAGAKPTLQAATGTALLSTTTALSPDGILKLIGADYVTIDGLTFTDPAANNDPTKAMEFGLGFFKTDLSDGCQRNTVKNCVFNLRKINNTAASTGVMNSIAIGSQGILMTNATATNASATALIPTTAAGANSYNTFKGNIFNEANMGITLIGYASGTAPFQTAGSDVFNTIGGSAAQDGNTFLNIGGYSASSAAGAASTVIFAEKQFDIKILYNTLDNTADITAMTGTYKGIVLGNSSSANAEISHNTIRLKSMATSGTARLTAIDLTGTTAHNNNTISVNDNIIENCTIPTAGTSSLLYGIANTSKPVTLNMENNIFRNNSIGDASLASATYSIIAIHNTSNTVSSGVVGQSFNVKNNQIYSNTINGQAGNFYGIKAEVQNTTCNGNIIRDISIPNVAGTTVSRIYGIFNAATNFAMTEIFTNNTIYNLTMGAGTGTAINQIWGISTSNPPTPLNTVTMSGNTIYGITNNSLNSNTRVLNVQASKDATIFNNKIYNITATGTGSSGATVTGIFDGKSVSGNTVKIYNNIIGDLKVPNSSGVVSALEGINTATNNVAGCNINLYNNTVSLNSPNTPNTNTAFGSKCIIMDTAPTVTLQNNIFVNNSTANGTGKSNVIERSDSTISTYASNNNLFYGQNILVENTATPAIYTTLNNYKTYVGTKDSNSISENPSFASTAGSDAKYLHINVGTATAINGGAVVIPTIDKDIDGDTRDNSTPDIGADEFTPALVNMTVTAPAAVCSTATANLTAAAITAGSEAGLTYTYWTDAQATSAYATPATATAGTYYIKGTNSTTGGFVIKSVTVVGAPNPSLIITNPAAVCAPAKADITAAAVTAGSDAGLTLSYWTDLAATNSYGTPAAATNGTYYIKATNPTTTCSTIQPVTVKVNTVTTPTLGTVTQPTCTTATGSVVLSGLPSGNWTITRHLVGGTAADDFHYYGSETTYTASGLATGTYKFDLSDVTFCTSAATANVVINPQPVAPAVPTLGTVTQPTCATATGSVALSGLSTGNWTITRHLVGGTAADDFHYYGSGTTYTVSGLAAGTYTFDWSDATYCTSVATANVFINAQPAAPSAPTGSAQQTFAQGKKVSDIVITKDPNGTVKWFDSEAKALAGTPALSNDDVLTTANYYGMQTVNGCTSSAPLVVAVTVTALGINDFDMAGLRYYPNPVKSELTVDYSNEISSIELFNLLGQQLRTVRPNSFSAKVDMSDLPMGTYLLQLCSEGKSRMIKVVKE